MLDVRDVTVRFGDRVVLDRASLEIGAGEIVALLGPSGSGKSTLLRVIAGIVTADAGRVVLDGVDVTTLPTHRRAIGLVFQDEQLFPHLSVADNIGFGLRMQGVPTAKRGERIAQMLALVGLDRFGSRAIDGLSGGERKRVALARSIAPGPKLLLLDEPLTGLDRELHDRLTTEVRDILVGAGMTAVWVTHDPDEAAIVASRTVALDELGPIAPPVATRPSAGGSDGAVVEVTAAETHPLRRTVLRDGTPSDRVEFDGDDEPTTFHLGCRVGTELVAVSTWVERPYPDRPAERGVQLRGMATHPDHRGAGLGESLLLAGLERSAAGGAAHVWARARDTALGFYERHGFATVGRGYVDLTTGLAHHDVIRPL